MSAVRTRVACVLASLTAACASDRGFRGTDDEDDAVVSCGVNAEPDGAGDCRCEDRYSWCDDGTEDCCAYDTSTFELRMISAVVVPYKDAGDLEPWDWDGDVPDWLIEALEILGELVPEAQTAAEVARLVDEYAPELLDGTVPPDPYLEATLGSSQDLFQAISTQDDTYDLWWNRVWRVTLTRSYDLNVWVSDEDLAFDDEIQGFYLTLEDLQWAAGRGEFTAQHLGNLFEVSFAVEPVW